MILLTAARMREIEGDAIERGEATGLQLMERAGAGVVEAVFERWPALAAGERQALVCCGPGNNGGDGFVIARLLKRRGWDVHVLIRAGDRNGLPDDAATNFKALEALEIPVIAFDDPSVTSLHRRADLVVDALFGAGLTRPLGDGYPAELGDIDTPVVAVDAPSGLCMDSGRVIGARAVRADLTVTFHRPRPGHYLAVGPDYCGVVDVVDIGLAGGGSVALHQGIASSAAFCRSTSGHKYDHGHVLVISGPATRTGAARLAARGALRIGAGLVTVASPPEALAENAAHLTAIMLRRLDGARGLRDILEDMRFGSVVIGPGLGVGVETRALVGAALSAGRQTVLDADALTAFAGDAPALFERLSERCVLTPHRGEFARLFPDIARRLAEPALSGPLYSKIDAVRDAAARAGCTILLKGADTVIADGKGRICVCAAVYDRRAPWLATAGSGDVLAGMIAGAGRAPGRGDVFEAARDASLLHQEAGRRLGPGLIAEDIPEILPAILRDLLSGRA